VAVSGGGVSVAASGVAVCSGVEVAGSSVAVASAFGGASEVLSGVATGVVSLDTVSVGNGVPSPALLQAEKSKATTDVASTRGRRSRLIERPIVASGSGSPLPLATIEFLEGSRLPAGA
jgi:hypothetical protein